MVEALHQIGITVTLLELSEQVMAPVDLEMANFVHQVLVQKQTDLRLNTGLTAITELPEHLELTLSNGEKLTTGLVILAIGVKPETMLASAAGLELGARGGIKVDEGGCLILNIFNHLS
jgi:pyruvate/2-oxoglutarate dehydrogenase complex dihydrolipoamide dehydrogenase (E3) component